MFRHQFFTANTQTNEKKILGQSVSDCAAVGNCCAAFLSRARPRSLKGTLVHVAYLVAYTGLYVLLTVSPVPSHL